ncbi:hypothetical protein BDN72DRAFT_903239 [Pluteus cervinus]|uniref:Uncharacterized protein n=1 Tax=Pluteus cervinus TaxID=181527 RepID=A0ACD3AAS0_9AGAR|nr:hypothetical protein BDN72DRAFT_903239 [Pluteus cervinus]
MLSIAVHGTQRRNEADPLKAGRYILSELMSFSLVNDCTLEDIPSNFLQRFSFPALQAFEYYVEVRDRESLAWLTSLGILSRVSRLTLQISHLNPEMLNRFVALAYNLEEISIYCSQQMVQDILDVLISIPSAQPTTLPNLKGLQLSWQWWNNDITDTAPLLQELARAWSPVEAVEGRPHRLTHLKMLIFNPGGDITLSRFLDPALQDSELRLHLETIHMPQSTLIMMNVPIAFEMYQPPFSEVRQRDILQSDGTWKTRYDPVYRIVD